MAKYRDAQREFDEARVRLRKDVQRDVERGRRAFLADLLDVVDNLDRAIEAARHRDRRRLARRRRRARSAAVPRASSKAPAWCDSKRSASASIRRATKPITVTPAADPSHDGLIVGVIAPGYQIGDEILRPAQVAVREAGRGRRP